MKHLYNNKKKNNSIVTAASFLLTLAATIILVAGTAAVIIAPLVSLQSADGAITRSTTRANGDEPVCPWYGCDKAAPIAAVGENVYMAWWTNSTTENGNEEVMFRASNDGGQTFSDKINLSNTTDFDSWRVEIAAEENNVYVSWWETNDTHDIPVARVSNDNGATFGPLLMLGANGTIGEEAAATEEGEAVEEEAVGGAEVAE